MRRLQDYLSEDSNQYGPGTDLIVSLLAVLLVMIFINGYLYRSEKERTRRLDAQLQDERNRHPAEGGSFRAAPRSFEAADFKKLPYWEFADQGRARAAAQEIVRAYRASQATYKFIFVHGHASVVDAANPDDPSPQARMIRNWGYAGGRAAVVSGLLQELLTEEERNRLVVCSAGEFDRKVSDPKSDENAYVEVFFGKEWKPPVRGSAK